MITMYFGLPGAGKTTLLAARALKFLRKGVRVYSNVPLAINDSNFIMIDNDWIGKYNIVDGVVLIDEAAIFASARHYKAMPKYVADWINYHRHYGVDIELYTQRYNGVDVNLRSLVQRLYHIRKHWLFRGLTVIRPVKYTIVIPKDGDKAGEIVEGYQMHGFLMRLFLTRWCVRKKYYKYFDSWDAPALPSLPSALT